MPRVTGIGGVFFRSRGDPQALAAWYEEDLGVNAESWGGAIFRWSEDPGRDKGATAWLVAGKDSNMFNSNELNFIVNYRVDGLESLIANLRKAEAAILRDPYADEQGWFASIRDPEGNRIELWEPKK